jgi:hypothetical protein
MTSACVSIGGIHEGAAGRGDTTFLLNALNWTDTGDTGGKFALVSLIPVANLPVSTTPAELVAKFAAGVVDIGGKFSVGVVDTDGNFVTGVVDTGGAPWLANISANFKRCFHAHI